MHRNLEIYEILKGFSHDLNTIILLLFTRPTSYSVGLRKSEIIDKLSTPLQKVQQGRQRQQLQEHQQLRPR